MKDKAQHIILDLYGCDPTLIDSIETVSNVLSETADLIGCEVLNKYFHKFSPQGVTGVICIAESHISIHTWPEHNYCAVDIFCCKDGADQAIEFIKTAFRTGESQIYKLERKFYEV